VPGTRPLAAGRPDALGWEIHTPLPGHAVRVEHDGHGDFTRGFAGVLADAAIRRASYEELATKLGAAFTGNVLQSPNFRAKPEVATIRFRCRHPRRRTARTLRWPLLRIAASSPRLELERRIDAIDAKLDVLARKIDQL